MHRSGADFQDLVARNDGKAADSAAAIFNHCIGARFLQLHAQRFVVFGEDLERHLVYNDHAVFGKVNLTIRVVSVQNQALKGRQRIKFGARVLRLLLEVGA